MNTPATIDSVRRRIRIATSSSALLLALFAGACADEAPEVAAASTAAERACRAVADQLSACGAATPCDEALVRDCASVAGILSDSYLTALTDCAVSGDAPVSCLADALTAAEPTEAHHALAAQFCEQCLPIAPPGCADVFFAGTFEIGGVEVNCGALVTPLGDDLVRQLTGECASGVGCGATFMSCAQQVLAQRALPQETLICVVDSLLHPVDDVAPGCGPSNTESSSPGGDGSGGSTSDGSTSSGTGGAGGSQSGGQCLSIGESCEYGATCCEGAICVNGCCYQEDFACGTDADCPSCGFGGGLCVDGICE